VISKRRHVAAATALAVALAAPLAAQTVRGTIALPNNAPASGVIVVAIDDHGMASARALSNSRGEFVLQLPRPGHFALRLLRIGYRPSDGSPVAVSGAGTVTTRLVFSAEPVVLPAVTVNAPETCRVGADTGLVIARVWEEARKAMLSTQLSADSAPLVAEWIEYDRTLDSTGRVVRDQRVRTSRHPTTHAFRSQAADFLADSGYVVTTRDVTTFYVPDVDVLLSDVFASGHCFALAAPPSASANLIGVAFHPSARRRAFRDIEGTLWLDRGSAELRKLSFAYTNLPEAALSAGAGGEVEFLRLDDGIWIVSRWHVRMPQLATERPMFSGLRRIVVAGTRVALRGVKESGGEVTSISERDSVLYQLLGSEIVVQIIGGDSLLLPAQAILALEGTDYVAAADARGRLSVSPVLSGRYRASVRTPLMDSLNLPAVERVVDAGTQEHVDTIALPTAGTLLELVTTDAEGHQLPHVTVDVQASRGSGRTVITGANGRVLLHDLPPGSATVAARRLGYRPTGRDLSIGPGRTVVPVVMQLISAETLDTVVVVDSSEVLPRHADFEARRSGHEATVSITREAIARRHATDTWQLLTDVPSVRVVDIDTMVVARSARTTTIANYQNDYCYLLVMVDGVPLNKDASHKAFDLRLLPRPEEIEGIEVFAGAASIPLKYGGSGEGKWCGLIAIWTR
jgi:hypothetical protein